MKNITKKIGRFMPSKSWMGIIAGLTMSLSAVAQTPSDEIIIVPYRQSNPALPHVAHRNAPITLKAIVRNCSSASAYTIAWDENRNGNFDDDFSFTVGRNGTTLTIPDIGRSITVPNVSGEPVLTYNVRVRVPGGADKFAAFNVKVHDFIPSPDPRNWTATQVDVMREMALQEYFWYLHRNLAVNIVGNHTTSQIRGNLPNDGNGFLATPAALTLFAANGRLPAYPPGTYSGTAPADFAGKNNARWNSDPYAETSMRMLNQMLLILGATGIAGGEEGNRTGYTNGVPITGTRIAGTVNNQGLYNPNNIQDASVVGSSGHYLQAIASTLPALGGTVATLGQSGSVNGKSIEYICQEMVDWLGFAQIDANAMGSWYYGPVNGSQNPIWDATGHAIFGLMYAEKYGSSFGVIVDNRHKYRIAEALVVQQKGDGGMGRFFTSSPMGSVQQTGYALAAARWLGFHEFPSDGVVPFPQEVNRPRGQFRQAYDRYVNFLLNRWNQPNQNDGHGWFDGFWGTGNYFVNNVSTAYNAPAQGNAYALNNNAIAFGQASSEMTTVGSFDWRKEFSTYGIRAQYRTVSGPRDGAYTLFGSSQQTYCGSVSYGCQYSAPFWATAMVAHSLTVPITEPAGPTAPEIEDQTFAVYENSSNATTVGTVVATGTEPLTYAITTGNESGAFAIDSASGEITVAESTALDFESVTSFALTIEVSDGNDPVLSSTATVTVNVNNVSEAPSGTDNTVTTLQDTPYNLTAADFGFSDEDVPAHNFVGIKLATAPAAGTLSINGNAIAAGATLNLAGVAGDTWTSRAGSGSATWLALASSEDGSKLVAGASGNVLTSTDYGVTWTSRLTGVIAGGAASSTDGTKLVIAGSQGNYLYTSTDSGVTWTQRDSSRNWSSVASSADGTRLIAGVAGGFVHTSTDSGVTWTARMTDLAGNWSGVASSADGTRLVAVAWGGQIYTSTDSGLTWMARESVRNWSSVASSADGVHLIASDSGGQFGGYLYTSSDAGETWTPSHQQLNWSRVAMSADGKSVLAGGTNQGSNRELWIFKPYSPSGQSWWSRFEYYSDWRALALSADGSRMAAGGTGTMIHTSVGTPTYPVFTPAPLGSGNPYTTFTFQVKDDGGTANGGMGIDPTPRTMTINVTAVNAPATNIVLSNSSIPENEPVGAGVGSLTAEDPDAGDTHTFALVSGDGDTDNAAFSIEDGQLYAAAVFDYETKSSFSIRVRATDVGGLSYEKQLTIEVANVVEPIVITAQPLEQEIAIGTPATLTVSVTGDAPQYQWRKNGSDIPDATGSSLAIADFQTEDAAGYDVVVSNGSGSETSEVAWLYVNGAETVAPTVTIVSPTPGERIPNNLEISISGKASDKDLGLAQVLYSLNGSDFQLADGTTNWTADVTLVPGTNTVEVKAIDLGNNESSVSSRRFYAVIQSPLTLTSNGFGTLVGEYSGLGTPADGAMLEVGRTYIVTAVPAANNLFSNWTESVSSTNARLKFIMESNMVLNANFVTNSFIRFGGIYNGLFSETNGLKFGSAGFVTLKIGAKLGVSGKIRIDGNVASFSGKINVDGTFSKLTKNRVRSADKPELMVNLALDLANATDTLTGTISLPGQGGWSSELLAHRVVWTKLVEGQATAFDDDYTMAIPGFTNNSEGPIGSGYGVVKVTPLGRIRLLGHAADANVLKQGISVSKTGDWPMFAPLYRTKRTNNLDKAIIETEGFVMGWLQFTNNNGEGNLAPVGEVHWINTGWTNNTYTNGFTNTIDVAGSRWSVTEDERSIAMTNALLTFAEGDLGASFEATYFVSTNTTLQAIRPVTPEDYPNSLQAALSAKKGRIYGTFVHPATSVRTKWFGVMLQDQNYGEGFFMGPSVGGKVTLDAVEVAPE